MGLINSDLENELQALPDKVADALLNWRLATLDREKTDALLYASIKGADKGLTATEIKAMIQGDQGHYNAVLAEIKAESEYKRTDEILMAKKKLASLRTAF
jgi:hypothetical protein